MKKDNFVKFVNIIARLSDRDLEVLKERFIKRKTLEDTAQLFKITKERVRQIEIRITKTIKEEMTNGI